MTIACLKAARSRAAFAGELVVVAAVVVVEGELVVVVVDRLVRGAWLVGGAALVPPVLGGGVPPGLAALGLARARRVVLVDVLRVAGAPAAVVVVDEADRVVLEVPAALACVGAPELPQPPAAIATATPITGRMPLPRRDF